MAKFKVGQRVKIDRKDATITKTNAEGHWDYYYFKFDGDPRERGIHESEISANSRACNAKFKVGDKVKLPDGKIGTIVKVVSFGGKTDNIIDVPGMSMTSRRSDELTLANSSTNHVVANAIAWKNALNMSSKQKSMQLVSARSEPVVQYTKVLPGKLYFRRLGRIYMCDDNDLNRKALEVQGFRILPYQVGGVVGNGTLATNAIHFGIGNKVMHRDSKMHGTIVGKYNAYLWDVKWDAGFTGPVHPDDLVFISMHSKCAANAMRANNDSVPHGWKVVKEGRDSWYGDYLALVQSESDPSKWACFTSGNLLKPTAKSEAEKDYKELATRTYNSRALNAVGADGKSIKIGDKVEWIDNGFHKGTVTLVDYNRIVVDGKYNADAMDIYHEGSHPFKNSRACNSSNPVVRKAMNAKVAMNSLDAKDKEEMSKLFKEMTDAISKISWLDMEFASYKKGLLNKAEKTQDKELTDWVQKAFFEWKKIKAKAMNDVRNNQGGYLRDQDFERVARNATVPSEIVTYVKTLEQASALIDKVRSSNEYIVRKIESLPPDSSERISAAKMFNEAHKKSRYVRMDSCITGVDIPYK